MTDAESMMARRKAASQRQFLDVASADEALQRFREALQPQPLGTEAVDLASALGRVLAQDVESPVDVPGFDRANVDGFALRAQDTLGASETAPRLLALTDEVITPGKPPAVTVGAGQASVIATGGMLPRGADAVMLVENTELVEQEGRQWVRIEKALPAGAFITFAGTDIGRGETVLRSGQLLSSRDIGLLAAVGLDRVRVYRKPRVAIISTGDELVQPGQPMVKGGVYDSNQAIVAAAVEELGCEAVRLGAATDVRAEQQEILQRGLEADAVILSGGTSKGAGDLTYEVVSALSDPGIVVHGVAIKPGKPLCLAVTGRKPVVILPGFPTSAIFTFQQFVAPMLRLLAGMPAETRETVAAELPVRVGSERGRTEYLMVGLMRTPTGYAAYPMGKNSGAVTAFSKADGFIRIDAQTEQLAAGTPVSVQLLSRRLEPADLVSIGAHCVGLDLLLRRLQREGMSTKSMHVGSQGGLAAVRRGECDLAGIHLMEPESGEYNRPYLEPGMRLLPGYLRMQGFVYRPDDDRFAEASDPREAVAAALADPECIMVNRNAGSGTRVLIDQLLEGAQPPGYAVQTKSHNAVATAVAQGRADWGVAIDTVARMYGLAFLPLQEEHYDFAVPESRWDSPAVQRFIALLNEPSARAELEAMGFQLYPAE
ncbi:MAG: molybdopterin biosynthesis protein [Candidatus Thiodiazotropha sp.]